LTIPNSQRLFYLRQAFRQGMQVREAYDLTKIDPWFLYQIRDLVQCSDELASYGTLLQQGREGTHLLICCAEPRNTVCRCAVGPSLGLTEDKIRQLRHDYDIKPVYKLVDTCAAEFEAYTPYFYSTYEVEDEAAKPTVAKWSFWAVVQPHRPGY